MKRAIALILFLAVISCKPSTELRLKITSSHGDYEDPGHSIEIFKGDHFETTLRSLTDKDGTRKYIAERVTDLPNDGIKYMTVVSTNDSTIFFSTTAEFLKHLNESGYELNDKKETQNDSYVDYSFKKK